jgi:hypothetical protein
MNIFDAHISGSLSVSSSAEISGDLTVLGTINATISGTTTNALTASEAPKYTLTSSFGNFTSSYTTGSFTGSFVGDGSGLHSIPASGVTGLNLNKIISGSVSASISPNRGFEVNTDATFTGSVNITGSIYLNGNPIGTGKLDETTFNSYTSSINGYTGDTASTIDTLSSSIATTTSGLDSRLDSLEGITGSYATTGSNLFKGTQTHSGSILPSVDNQYDLGSTEYQWRDVYISSGSLYIDGTKVISSTSQELVITTDNGQSIKILESTTDSIILQTADGDIELKSSADGDILLDPTNGKIMLKGPVEILNGQKIQSSVGGTPVVFANDIVVSGSIDLTGTIEGINLTDFSSSVNSRFSSVEGDVTSLNSFSSSANTRLSNIETSTSSLNSFTSSINTTIKSKLNTEGVISGSIQVDITGTTGYSTFSSSVSSSNGSLSSSIATTTSNVEGRASSLESKTGSYATTGSNIFKSNQTISGSVIITENLTVFGSSSITYVTSSQLRVEDNIITVNTASPGQRFGGLEVHDSGSIGIATGSLLWDSVNNRWIYQNSSEASYGGGVLLSGPRSSGSLGSELTLTSGRIAKSAGGDHLNDSNISDDGTTVTINSATVINGTITSTGTTLVSGSSQISYTGLSNIPSGIVSGSSQVTSLLPNGTVSGSSQVLNGSGVWSGSAQLPSGVVSGSSQITYSGLSGIPTGIVSGSSQVSFTGLSNIPSGIVSGSSQIDLTATTNYSSGIKTRLSAEGVISGSSQIDLTATTNYSSGIKSRLNAEGVISGSSQISFGSISSIPSGLVSGSSQITLSSTTGYGSVLNQAVLTTSTPTFAELTITSNQDGKLTLRVPSSGDTNDWNYINFVGANGTRDMYFGTDSGGNPTWYRDDNGVNIGLGSVATVNGTQIVTNSGTWSINITGNANTATTASSLSSMNISQFTNNSGYITGISFANVSSKPTTISGYGITDAITTTNISSQSVNYANTAGSTTFLNNVSNYAWSSSTLPTSYPQGLQLGFVGPSAGEGSWQNYGTVLTARTYAGGGGSLQMYVPYGPSNGGDSLQVRFGNYNVSSGNSWTGWKTLIDSGNIGSQSVSYATNAGGASTLGGISASGFWQAGGSWGADLTSNGFTRQIGVSYTGGEFAILTSNSQISTLIDGTYFAGEQGGFYSLNSSNQYSTRVGFNRDGSGNASFNASIVPTTNGTLNLGTASARWNTVFTSDLSMSNGIGDYTIVEGEEDLFIYNNKTNKVFKFLLQEVDPLIAPPKKI